jgi:hypothetical protein
MSNQTTITVSPAVKRELDEYLPGSGSWNDRFRAIMGESEAESRDSALSKDEIREIVRTEVREALIDIQR